MVRVVLLHTADGWRDQSATVAGRNTADTHAAPRLDANGPERCCVLVINNDEHRTLVAWVNMVW
jgi:hypothetical protein